MTFVSMRLFTLALTCLVCHAAFGQEGYIKVSPDSTISGYLRHYEDGNGKYGLELWRTKKDKHPLRIPATAIYEYAIKKDTFRVLHQYRPFEFGDIYYEIISLRRQKGGKVNYYLIDLAQNILMPLPSSTGAPTIALTIPLNKQGKYSFIYILEHRKTGYLHALPYEEEELPDALMNFFPERFVTRYAEQYGKIKITDVHRMVSLYNSK